MSQWSRGLLPVDRWLVEADIKAEAGDGAVRGEADHQVRISHDHGKISRGLAEMRTRHIRRIRHTDSHHHRTQAIGRENEVNQEKGHSASGSQEVVERHILRRSRKRRMNTAQQ